MPPPRLNSAVRYSVVDGLSPSMARTTYRAPVRHIKSFPGAGRSLVRAGRKILSVPEQLLRKGQPLNHPAHMIVSPI